MLYIDQCGIFALSETCRCSNVTCSLFASVMLSKYRAFLTIIIAIVVAAPLGFSFASENELSFQNKEITAQLIPEKNRIMLGEPIQIFYVVKNLSHQDLNIMVGGDYRNEFGRPETFSIKTIRDDGRNVPEPQVGFNAGGWIGPQRIPAHGEYVFKLFLPNWATFEEHGDYTITAQRTLEFVIDLEVWRQRFKDSSKVVEIQSEAITQITVLPYDYEQLGGLIDTLGKEMLSKLSNDRQIALKKMCSIYDVRVIPHLIEAFQKGGYDTKFNVLRALEKFDDSVAFEGLKRGLEVRAEDFISESTNEVVANTLVENIQHAAISAIARSSYPDAIPFLLTQRNHELYQVRLTVVHKLGQMSAKDAIPFLEGMKSDQHDVVRAEVLRYLEEFDSTPIGETEPVVSGANR